MKCNLLTKMTVICLSLFTSVLFAATYYVATYGTDNGNGSSSSPFPTIQEAIYYASDGDVIFVYSGTYNESLTITTSLTIIGAGSASTFVTGGVSIAADDIKVDSLSLTGSPSGENTVIWVDGSAVRNNITISNCVIDGESDGKYAFYGSDAISGDLTFDGNVIKNITSWYVMDVNGSSHTVSNHINSVKFTNNEVYHVGGSIAFRGKFDEPTNSAVISGNTMYDLCGSSCGGWIWAGIEVNNTSQVDIFNNDIRDAFSEGAGNGHALELFSMTPWNINIHDNTFTNNAGGIWILTGGVAAAVDLGAGMDPPLVYHTPTGSVNNNDLSGNSMYGLAVNDSNGGGPMGCNEAGRSHNSPCGSAGYSTTDLYDSMSSGGGPVDATNNWWGSADGPSSSYNINVDVDPWYINAEMTTLSMGPPVTSVDITGTSGFRMLSSPVSGAVYGDLLDELYTQGVGDSCDAPDVDPNVWTWNNSWNALSDLTTDNYTAGSGVLVYVYADTDFDGTDDLPVTLTVGGTQNTSPVTIATNEDNWNLLGNPYGYSLSIQQLAADNSAHGSVYIWDSAADVYRYHTGSEGTIADGLIAPFQGFFSYAAAGAASYTFTQSSISSGTGTNYRTAVESEGSGMIAFTSGDQVSEVFISFNLTGDLGMDHADAYRLMPLSHNDHLVSMFYVGDEAIAVNNLPYDFNADLSVDLDVMQLQATDTGFDPVSETVTMTWDLADIPEGINVVMMNNETHAIINLHEMDEYTFTLADKDGFELGDNVISSYPLVGQSQFTMFMSSATAASHEEVLPDAFTLQPAYPNPFNPSTTIRYSIPETGSVLVKVYDLSGREVSTLVDQVMPAGYHSLSWNPQYTAAAGIYIVQVISGREVLNQKITYLK